MSPREQWVAYKQEIVKAINLIDTKVPFSENGPPQWWTEMMDVQKLIIHTDMKNAEGVK